MRDDRDVRRFESTTARKHVWSLRSGSEKERRRAKNMLAERGFDPRTSGLWAQHASAAPLCSGGCLKIVDTIYLKILYNFAHKFNYFLFSLSIMNL